MRMLRGFPGDVALYEHYVYYYYYYGTVESGDAKIKLSIPGPKIACFRAQNVH